MINTFLYLIINIVIYFIVSTSLLYLVSDTLFHNIFIIVIFILSLINFVSQNTAKYKHYIKTSLNIAYVVLFIVLLLPINNIAKIQFVGAWLLLGYILSNELLSTTHNKMKSQFKFSFYVLSFMLILAMCIDVCMLAFEQVFIYIMIYYVLAISINRCLRDKNNISNNKQYYTKLIVELLSSLSVICLFYFTKIYIYIYDILIILFNCIMQVLAWFLSKIMIFLAFVYRKLWDFLLLFKKDLEPQDIIDYEEKFTRHKIDLEEVVTVPQKIIYDDQDYRLIIIIIILILTVALAFWLYYINKRKNKSDKSVTIVRESIKNNKKRDKKNKLFMNNVELVRYYYRKLLKGAKRKSIKFYKNDTTLDINNKLIVKDYNKVTLFKIREIYLKARYSNLEVTKEDVTNIKKEIGKNIKKDK